jgi:quinol-cytochrome oxidoreductase complex cytochrome b subunit
MAINLCLIVFIIALLNFVSFRKNILWQRIGIMPLWFFTPAYNRADKLHRV